MLDLQPTYENGWAVLLEEPVTFGGSKDKAEIRFEDFYRAFVLNLPANMKSLFELVSGDGYAVVMGDLQRAPRGV